MKTLNQINRLMVIALALSYAFFSGCSKERIESVVEEEPEEQDTTCNDSDGGHDTFTRGITSGIIGGTSTYGTKKDGCYDETRLIEYFCYDGPDVDEIGKVFSTSYLCDYACKDGACIPKPKCIDSDGGNYKKKYGTLLQWCWHHAWILSWAREKDDDWADFPE